MRHVVSTRVQPARMRACTRQPVPVDSHANIAARHGQIADSNTRCPAGEVYGAAGSSGRWVLMGRWVGWQRTDGQKGVAMSIVMASPIEPAPAS